MRDDDQRRRAQQQFLKRVEEAELPPPDEIWWEEHATVFQWNEHGPGQIRVFADADPDEIGPLDAFDRAMILGLPYDQWPVGT